MTTDSKTPDGTGNVVDLSTAPVRRDCMNCGGFVMTNPRAKPLCINCRDRGLRTDDDVAEAMAQARREEREACAKVCRAVESRKRAAARDSIGFLADLHREGAGVAYDCGEAIRSRGADTVEEGKVAEAPRPCLDPNKMNGVGDVDCFARED